MRSQKWLSVVALYWFLVVQIGGSTEYAQRGFPSFEACASAGRARAIRLTVRPGNPTITWTCTPEAGDRR
jgi:hypothetical protein